MERALLLDVVVGKSPAIFELFSSEDETLLVWWNTLLVLNLRLYVVDRVGALNFEGDGLTREGLDEYLHTTAKSENKMECRFFLDVVIRQGAAIFQLLPCKNETPLVWL